MPLSSACSGMDAIIVQHYRDKGKVIHIFILILIAAEGNIGDWPIHKFFLREQEKLPERP
jgi:NADH:ubiquinone oxidoreductase subunit K